MTDDWDRCGYGTKWGCGRLAKYPSRLSQAEAGGVVRRRPYTEDGVRRVACGVAGCRRRGARQWQVRSCQVGGPNRWVPVCEPCDAALNAFVRAVFGLTPSRPTP